MVVLDMPLPPSPNTVNSRNPLVRAASKRKYQRAAWVVAVKQAVPMHDPPERVVVSAHFRVHNIRDEDNLHASLKWVLDTLRQKQTGKDWRSGVYSSRGFLVDDDPAHMQLGRVTQEIDRQNKGVRVWLEEAPPHR